VDALAEVRGAGVVDTRSVLEKARDSMSSLYDAERGMREPPPEPKEAGLLLR
jgi:hypothetical protein